MSLLLSSALERFVSDLLLPESLFKAKFITRKMSIDEHANNPVKEYRVDVLLEGLSYFDLFSARDAIEKVGSISQNIRSIISSDTGSNLYLLASEAIERALSLKKTLDDYNESLLVPVCFSWITVAPNGSAADVWEGAHKKPYGNCGILLHPDVEWSRELEGFTSLRLERGALCLERRLFSVEKEGDDITLITEPLVLALTFASKAQKESFVISPTIQSFSEEDTALELYLERLDCSLIKRAFSLGAVEYALWREQEIVLFGKKKSSRKTCRRSPYAFQPSRIPKSCLSYCDLLEELPAVEEQRPVVNEEK